MSSIEKEIKYCVIFFQIKLIAGGKVFSVLFLSYFDTTKYYDRVCSMPSAWGLLSKVVLLYLVSIEITDTLLNLLEFLVKKYKCWVCNETQTIL